MDKEMELLQGTLDRLILKAVSLGPLHGSGVLRRIQQISKDRLAWGQSKNKRKAKYYRLTAGGKRKLQTEAEKWNRMADVIAAIRQSPAEEV